MDDESNNFNNSDFMRRCSQVQGVVPLLAEERYEEVVTNLLQIFKDRAVPGVHHLIGCCQFMLQKENAATHSLLLNNGITAFHKNQALQALEIAKKRFNG